MAASVGAVSSAARLATIMPNRYAARKPEPPSTPVAAKTLSPPATSNSARMPPPASRAAMRRSSAAISTPPARPITVPQPNCCTKVISTSAPGT